MEDRAVILGCRGSVSVSGKQYAHFGGATSCVFVHLGGQSVVLDAGTGLLALPDVLGAEREIPVLISHPHVDHLMGLPICPNALMHGYRFHIWAEADPEENVRRLMSPPLWPVGPEMLPADFVFHTVDGSFQLGTIQVDCLPGNHPGGVTLFRLTGNGKSVAYIPDCTLAEDMMDRAADFAKNCDLLLCDGQIAPEKWKAYSGFGHSTWEMAAQLGALCAAKRTRIFHHDPSHTDDILHRAAADLTARFPGCDFAYEGEEISL